MNTQIISDDTDAITWPVNKAVLDELNAAEERAAVEQIAALRVGSASDQLKLMKISYAYEPVERMTNLAILGPNATIPLDAGVVTIGMTEAKSRFAPTPHIFEGLKTAPIIDHRRWRVEARTFEYVIYNTPDVTATPLLSDVERIGPDPLAKYERKYSKPNWDFYGAEPITGETVEAAHYFLDILPITFGAPHISPASDGTISLEWVFNDGRKLRKLYLDIGPSYTWKGFWRIASGEHRTILPKPIDLKTKPELAALFDELSD